MKKLALIAIFGMLAIGATSLVLMAQDQPTASPDTSVAPPKTQTTVAAVTTQEAAPAKEEKSMHQVIKEKFIEGGPGFMGTIALSMIVGLACAIERIIYLSLATTNTKKLIDRIEKAMEEGGLEAAKEICRDTRGPVAGIFYQGLLRYDEGLDQVEKSIISYGSVQMGLLEKGLTWVSLMISIAPMLGFLGTVVGMVQAFDAIQQAGEISPTLVAAGIKVALLTTVFGLIVAMILQVLYNYCLSKIDSITNDMEDGSISFMDLMIRYNMTKK
ncbi:MAG: MotA/TolQ/ExbB proton channel family protein [Bacteroidota bacterium]